jgi:hypothetical protein
MNSRHRNTSPRRCIDIIKLHKCILAIHILKKNLFICQHLLSSDMLSEPRFNCSLFSSKYFKLLLLAMLQDYYSLIKNDIDNKILSDKC